MKLRNSKQTKYKACPALSITVFCLGNLSGGISSRFQGKWSIIPSIFILCVDLSGVQFAVCVHYREDQPLPGPEERMKHMSYSVTPNTFTP